MKHLPLLFAALLPFAACSKTEGTPPKSGAGATDEHGHGAKQALGPMTIGAHSFELVQFGSVKEGAETAIEMAFAKDKPLPSTVRAWIGIESGAGSRKSPVPKDADEPNTLHGHLDAPKPLPAGSKIWIEIEENGKTQTGSAAWK